MPTRAEVNILKLGMQGAANAAKRELKRFWISQDLADLETVRKNLEVFFPSLVDAYGEAAAVAAGDWFENVTGVKSQLATIMNPEQLNARMRWAIGTAFEGNHDQAVATLQMIIDETVKQYGRDTIVMSATKNKIRFARVPAGSETCAFCMMLASRGFVYDTTTSAGELDKFHGDCDCQIVPDDGVMPKGYDPDELYDKYKAVHKTGDSKEDVAAKLRQAYGLK